MEKALGQSLIVENVPGAAGQLGAQRVKQADAGRLHAGADRKPARPTPRHQAGGAVDLLRDFEPVGQTGDSTSIRWCVQQGELGIKTFC